MLSSRITKGGRYQKNQLGGNQVFLTGCVVYHTLKDNMTWHGVDWLHSLDMNLILNLISTRPTYQVTDRHSLLSLRYHFHIAHCYYRQFKYHMCYHDLDITGWYLDHVQYRHMEAR